jgi:ring-1,2-phenylacetyl-CoA epoxidase subunit PaaC
MNTKHHLYTYSLRLGDDALILGHRLSEWCSRGPFLEEDLALTNISLDMIGQAQAFLKYAGEVADKRKTEDELAYRRDEQEYTNHLIVEIPNKDFAFTIARQLFFSAYEYFLYDALSESKDATIAGIAAKAVKEARYHLEHAADWTIRLGDGTEVSREKIQRAINALWNYTGELFEMDETDKALLKEGIAADLISVRANWNNRIKAVLAEATLQLPEDNYMHTGGRKGVHTENLGHILCEMQYLHRAYPDATW